MSFLPRHTLLNFGALFFCLVTQAQALEVATPTQPKTADGASAVNPPVAHQPQQLVLSLGNAVAIAVSRNIDLRVEAINFKMAETDTSKSWGIYNPVLNISGTGGVTAIPGDAFFSAKTSNASIGLTQNLPTGGNIAATTQTGYFSINSTDTTPSKNWQSTAGLNITIPLLKNAGRETVELNITVAANTQQDSLERFRAATIETVSNVITSYNHLYVLRQALETRVAALNSAQRILDEIRKKATPGAVQGLELANAEFAIAQRRKDLVDASRSVKDQELGFRYLIGLEVPAQIIPSDPPSRDEPKETEEQAAKAALENRSDLRQLQLGLKTTQLQERVARRQSWPDLSVNGSGGFTGSGFNFGQSYQGIGDHQGTYWTVGMQFTAPLGNTTAEYEYRKSRLRTEQVQDQIRSLSWKIRNDVESDMRALISARLQMQLTDRSKQLAEQRVEEYHKNNQLGSATIQDVLNSENDRNTALNAQLEAVETFSNAVTKLWKDTGLLLDRRGIHIDSAHPDKLTENKEQNPSLPVGSPTSGRTFASPASGAEQTQNRTVPFTPAASGVVAQKPVTGGMEKTPSVVPAPVAVVSLSYTLTIGEYGTKSAMADAIKRIKRAGLVPHVKQGPTKTEAMIRLYVADYSDMKTARSEIGRLHRLKADGFIISANEGKFFVYAGSHRGQKQAIIEQERLAALGVKTVLKEASIPRETYLLTAGSFATLKSAVTNATKLEKQGLKAAITENAD